MSEHQPNLAHPFAPHRLRIYLGAVVFLGLFLAVMTIGSASGLVPPTTTVDVIANLVLSIPAVSLPFIVFWDAPGEKRTRLEKAAELTLVYLPFTASSQLTYELTYLVGNLFGAWAPTSEPGWKWYWWQYGLADTRFWGDNPYIFGFEVPAVIAGTAVLVAWLRLIRSDITDESRIRNLWVGFAGCAVILGTTTAYFVSEARSGFGDIGQGLYGLGFKFIFLNLAFIIFPAAVLYAIHMQIDYLNRRVGARDAANSSNAVLP